MYKAGIIGAGRIGVEFEDCHKTAYEKCPDTELVFIRDIDPAKCWGEVQHVDILSICTPPETHKAVLHRWITYAKAIYLEKPIATTLEDADAMINLCHNWGVILQVNHQRRFGRPTMYFNRGVLNNGTHAFDMLRMLFGEPYTRSSPPDNLNTYAFYSGAGVQYVDVIETPYSEKTDFRFEIVGGTILKGVEHLVDCIKNGHESISSGEEAREDLRLCLEYRKLHPTAD